MYIVTANHQGVGIAVFFLVRVLLRFLALLKVLTEVISRATYPMVTKISAMLIQY